MSTSFLTIEEIFDTVSVHLLSASKQCAEEDGSCVYRTPGSIKLEDGACAAGCLIKDQYYDERSLEGNGVKCYEVIEALERSGINMRDGRIADMVLDLQRVHDAPYNWGEKGLNKKGKKELAEIEETYIGKGRKNENS